MLYTSYPRHQHKIRRAQYKLLDTASQQTCDILVAAGPDFGLGVLVLLVVVVVLIATAVQRIPGTRYFIPGTWYQLCIRVQQ